MHACMHIMLAYHACMHACMHIVRACMHIMRACIRWRYNMHACMFGTVRTHNIADHWHPRRRRCPFWNPLKFIKNQWNSINIDQNPSKSINIYQNFIKIYTIASRTHGIQSPRYIYGLLPPYLLLSLLFAPPLLRPFGLTPQRPLGRRISALSRGLCGHLHGRDFADG